MSDYIEREAVLAEYDRQHKGPPGGARKIIEEFPASDVVAVVRCGNCKHHEHEPAIGLYMCEITSFCTSDDYYCKSGISP